MTTSPLRLGIVPYMNVLPLLEGLEDHFPRAQWVRATPRELAGLLANGEIDIATLPIFEALRAADRLRILPGCAIACDGAVRSVVIDSHSQPADWKRVLLDRSSLTSVNLARIVCRDHLGIDPEFVLSDEPVPRDFDLVDSGFDAAVVIGDVALDWEGRHPVRVDLGAAWKAMTGLPFVFAAWVARRGADVADADVAALIRARERGTGAATRLAREHAHQHRHGESSLVQYLTEAIRYELGGPEWEAIALFREKLESHGAIARGARASVGDQA